MKSLFKLHQNHVNTLARYRAKQDELNKQKNEIERQMKDMNYPHFMDYLKQLGKELLPKVKGAVKYEVMGPFGLGNEMSLYFSTKRDRTVGGITFTRYGDGYGIVNYKVDTGKYKSGTIGAMNRMNHPAIEITKDITIEWLLKFIKWKSNQ